MILRTGVSLAKKHQKKIRPGPRLASSSAPCDQSISPTSLRAVFPPPPPPPRRAFVAYLGSTTQAQRLPWAMNSWQQSIPDHS